MLLKKGNDPLIQVIQTTHPVSHSVAVIPSNHAAPKKTLECVKQLDVPLVLYNCELRKDLKPGRHFRMGVDSDEEATFAVHKPNHPVSLELPRLVLNVKSLRVLHFWSLP